MSLVQSDVAMTVCVASSRTSGWEPIPPPSKVVPQPVMIPVPPIWPETPLHGLHTGRMCLCTEKSMGTAKRTQP